MLTKMCNRPRSEPTSWPGNQAPEDYAATLLPAEPHSQDTVFMVRVQRRFRGWRLMVISAASLSEIALNAGFSDQSHLSRHFRAAFGQSPASWRREHVNLGREIIPHE